MEYSRVYENAQVLLLSIQVAAVVVLGGLVVFVLNLGCEVVADVANVADVVLNHQGHVGGHGQRHLETMRNIISIISFQYLLKAGCSALLNV